MRGEDKEDGGGRGGTSVRIASIIFSQRISNLSALVYLIGGSKLSIAACKSAFPSTEFFCISQQSSILM